MNKDFKNGLISCGIVTIFGALIFLINSSKVSYPTDWGVYFAIQPLVWLFVFTPLLILNLIEKIKEKK